MAAKKTRLFKIASEINIGKDAIVQFLNQKGFEIENKPTAKLTPEMVDLVYEKFKREKRAAEKQREKIQKHKDARRTAAESKAKAEEKAAAEKAGEEQAPATGETAEKEAEEVPEAPVAEEVEEIEEKPAEEKAETPEETDEAAKEIAAEEVDSEVAEHIAEAETEKEQTLKPDHEDGIHRERIEADEAKIEEDEEHIRKEAGVTSEPEPVADEETGEKAKEEETIPPKKTKEKPEPEKEEIAEEETAEEKPAEIEKTEKKEEKPAAKKKEKPGKKEEAEEEEKKKQAKKRKKRKKVVEVESEENGDYNLRGLTIVGKIDLGGDKEKREKIRRKKKTAKEEEAEKAKAKPTKKHRKKKDKPKELEIDKEKIKEKAFKPEKEKKRRKRKKSIREQISQEDVEKAIKQTLHGMEDTAHGGSRAKMRQKKRLEREEKQSKKQEKIEQESKKLRLTEFVTTSDLANLMDINPNDVILKCMELGLMVTINQRLDKDTITLIADDYGFDVEFVDEEAVGVEIEEEEDEKDLEPRPPIVTIMGHVDHGKTSLLDHIRNSNIVAGESGGITQHIGAYRVDREDSSITFLDTPGHEAFTAMRARGAQVTDIVILVVAADDSVMPQTIEAISHARAANVPIVVAVNKIDKPDSQPDRIKQQLADHHVLVEDWGGKFQSVEISAKKGINIDQLLEKITLEAELLELKANPKRTARGVVVEANMTKGLGTVATVIVQKGELKIGDPFVSGVFSGRVRAMFDERGNKVQSAGPSTPVSVIGFDGLPEAGDNFAAVESDQEARHIATQRQQLKREQELRQVRHVTLDEISQQIQLGGVKDLHLVIKGDVSGSVEALSDSLLKLSRDEVRVSILHKGVGNITESDVMLAVASGAVIVGFHVSTTAQARRLAENEKVDIRLYDIIYDCINEVQLALEGLLKPEIKENVLASIEVRQLFRISRLGVIAGCYVLNGKVTRNDKVRVLRDGLPVYTGSVSSLKRGKEDAKQVEQGFECGIMIDGFHDYEVGDILECFKLVEVKRTFS
jgi:translation initiation factor IF-2